MDMNTTEIPRGGHRRRPKRGSRALPIIAAALAGFMLASSLAAAAYFFLIQPKMGGNPIEDVTPEPELPVGDETSPESATTERLVNPDAEVRGAYIATAANINFPSKQGMSADELRAEIDDIIATAEDANLNALYFQVRPASDALYDSKIFPASNVVSGEQGKGVDGLDILAYLIEKAHAENIKIHAWVNPLRVTTGTQANPNTDVSKLAAANPARQHPEWTVAYADGKLYYDPAIPEVRKLIADGVKEIAENYDVDGILFDDYFYPYPVSENGAIIDFDDADSYSKYGNGKDKGDWRRANVNAMIAECHTAIKSVNTDCKFGVAPFGIWRNDDGKNGGSDTSGLESYKSIYCDPTAWVEGGYVDYLAPQIYWRFSTPAAKYDVLVRWWNTLCEGTGVDLLISHGVYNYVDTWENAENEFRDQIGFARSELAYRGSILYGWQALKTNAQGLLDETKDVFKEEIVYTGTQSNDSALNISIPYSGTYIDGDGSFVIGSSDPSEPLYLDGKKVGRTKSGYFSVYLPLGNGENRFTFSHKGVETEYILNRGKQPVTPSKTVYTQLDGYKISSHTPSKEWFSTTEDTISVSVAAPSGSTVTAKLGGTTVPLKPTINPPDEGDFMREVYTGELSLSEFRDSLGTGEILTTKIEFTAKRGNDSATSESAEIIIGPEGTTIPVKVLKSDSELKIQPDSWYYDDYTPQSEGMQDNAVLASGGLYKLRCGGYISADRIEKLDTEPFGIAQLGKISLTSDDKSTYITLDTDVNVPVNCYIENGEFILTVYNVDTSTAPKLEISDNLLFTSARQEKSVKANAYKYFLKLYDTENFYGFDHYYNDGKLIVSFRNPTSLPDTDKPLTGKTIVLDAGHGGRNPGALGPLGNTEGAMNESDFNLEIVMAAKEKLEELGADIVLTRDRETEIDVPINDRMDKLIEVQPDICISVHQNSMPYTTDITKVRGLVGLYWSDSGYMLTDILGGTMARRLDKLDRSPTKQRLAMVRNPKFPSTLVEVCFITNVEEYERMMQPGEIGRIADYLAEGVLNYYAAQAKYLKK